MSISRLLGTGPAGENLHHGRLALRQSLQCRLHLAQVVETVHALGAAAELAGCLRASQQQLAENGDFAAVEIEGFLEPVLELSHAVVYGVRGPARPSLSNLRSAWLTAFSFKVVTGSRLDF